MTSSIREYCSHALIVPLHSPEYGYGFSPSTRADWPARSFSVPGHPYSEHGDWRLQEPATVDSLGHLPPTTHAAAYGAPAGYSYLPQHQHQQQQQQHHARDVQNFGQPLRSASTSAPWTDVDRSQPSFGSSFGGAIPVPSTHPQGMMYGHPYTQADAQHLQAVSSAQHAAVPPGYPPNYTPQHSQWHPYAQGAQYAQSGRHDSANGGWAHGAQATQGTDPNYHFQQGGPEHYKRGSGPS